MAPRFIMIVLFNVLQIASIVLHYSHQKTLRSYDQADYRYYYYYQVSNVVVDAKTMATTPMAATKRFVHNLVGVMF